MPSHALTPKQNEFLGLLAAGLPLNLICRRMGISRQRHDQYLAMLRKYGYVISTPTEESARWERHPQDSLANPWPPPARVSRVRHPDTHSVIVIRAVLLPRLEQTDAIPDEKVVHVTDCATGQQWCWSASRNQRWSASATRRALSYPGIRHDPTAAPRGFVGLTKTVTTMLAQEIAWALDVEAVLDDVPIAALTEVQPAVNGG